MNLQNFTIKSQETIVQAQQIAGQFQNQQIEDGHLLQALLEGDENTTHFLPKKMGVNIQNIQQELNHLLNSYPKISGGNSQSYLSKTGNAVIQKAISLSEKTRR